MWASPGEGASSSLQPRAGPTEGLSHERETPHISGAGGMSPLVLRGDLGGTRLHPPRSSFIHSTNTGTVPDRVHLSLTHPAAAILSLLLLVHLLLQPPQFAWSQFQEWASALIASLSSMTWIAGDISWAQSCIPVAAYSPCHRRSLKLSPVES